MKVNLCATMEGVSEALEHVTTMSTVAMDRMKIQLCAVRFLKKFYFRGIKEITLGI